MNLQLSYNWGPFQFCSFYPQSKYYGPESKRFEPKSNRNGPKSIRIKIRSLRYKSIPQILVKGSSLWGPRNCCAFVSVPVVDLKPIFNESTFPESMANQRVISFYVSGVPKIWLCLITRFWDTQWYINMINFECLMHFDVDNFISF